LLFDAALDIANGVAQLTLYGNLNDAAEPIFKAQLDKIVAAQPQRVVFRMENLDAMSKESARALGFVCAQLPFQDALDENIYVVGANTQVKETLQSTQVWEELKVIEMYDATKLEKSS